MTSTASGSRPAAFAPAAMCSRASAPTSSVVRVRMMTVRFLPADAHHLGKDRRVVDGQAGAERLEPELVVLDGDGLALERHLAVPEQAAHDLGGLPHARHRLAVDETVLGLDLDLVAGAEAQNEPALRKADRPPPPTSRWSAPSGRRRWRCRCRAAPCWSAPRPPRAPRIGRRRAPPPSRLNRSPVIPRVARTRRFRTRSTQPRTRRPLCSCPASPAIRLPQAVADRTEGEGRFQTCLHAWAGPVGQGAEGVRVRGEGSDMGGYLITGGRLLDATGACAAGRRLGAGGGQPHPQDRPGP